MNAFHVLGGMLALWALLLSFLGVTRESFPASKQAERAVIAISITLWICAVGSAVLTAIDKHNEEKEHESKGGAENGFVLPV